MGRKLSAAELGGAEITMSKFPEGQIFAGSRTAEQALATAKQAGPNVSPQMPRVTTPKSTQP
jgi:hypothetical protein